MKNALQNELTALLAPSTGVLDTLSLITSKRSVNSGFSGTLLELFGKTLGTYNITDNKTLSLSTAILQSGVYFLVLNSDVTGHKETHKIIVTH